MSPAGVSGFVGAGALRFTTLGGELTPETNGDGSSAWTTASSAFLISGGDVGTGVGGFEATGVGGLISTVGLPSSLSLESDFFTNCDSVRVMWIIGGGD